MNEQQTQIDYPADWEKPITQRGLTRVLHAGHYMVRLSLLGAQRYVGVAKSQSEAAKLYDLALWKCAPLIPGKLRPNYPDQFADTIQREVDTACPHLNDLYAELVKQAGFLLDEQEAREAKLAKPIEEVNIGAKDYKAYCDAISLTAANTIKAITRLSTLRLRLKLTKLPTIARLADEYSATLEAAEKIGIQLRAELAHHEKFYRGLVAPPVNADNRDKGNDIWTDKPIAGDDVFQ